jgi:hypothetical protein
LQTPLPKVVAERSPWANYRTLVDICTAQGCFPVQVARLHPHITGGGFDLPELSKAFANYCLNELSGRLRFHPGNFFHDDVPVFGRVPTQKDEKMLLHRPIRRSQKAVR